MTFGQIRFVKRLLLALFLGTGVYVGLQVWQGVRGRATRPVEDPIEETDVALSREVAIEQLDSEGRTAWTLKAAESSGRTENAQVFRDVEIRFDAGEEKVPVVVTADYCEIRNDDSVYLEGNVVVRDEGSLRIDADTLHFRRGPDRAWSDQPVRYSRKGLSGDAGSLHYALVQGVLELGSGVAMTLQGKGESPVRIESERAVLRRRQHVVQFVDSVSVRERNRSLECGDLRVAFDEDNEYMERLEAFESVDLRMVVAGGEIVTAGATKSSVSSEPGTKRLLTEKLEAFFRPGGGEIERARALEGGKLVMRLPEGAQEGYHKDLEGYTLVFEFDEEGRLVLLRGRGGVTLLMEPAVDGSEAWKRVTARQLEADFDPLTGELRDAVCESAVTFEQGDIRATGEKGTFRNAESLLVLEKGPRLSDQKASLEADVIHVGVVSGDVAGMGSVRSTSKKPSAQGGGKGLFPSESEEPVYFVSEEMRFDRARDTAVYTGSARGLQGPNRIEAERIEIEQEAGVLSASGNVETTFLQKVGKEAAEPTVTEAERFVYRSGDGKLHYEGAVAMRSGSLTLKGRGVEVVLEEAGREVSEILANGEVAIETSDGTAYGDTARYLPKEESMTVQGESARLENAGKLTEGKQLTFFLGNDKIFVDGREQARTKTTYSSKPRF